VPAANEDQTQLDATRKFLQANQLSVDIFALSPAKKERSAPARNELGKQELSTTFAVGEESEAALPKGEAGEGRAVTAPIDRTDAAVRRGDPRRLLAAMLQREQPEVREIGDVDALLRANPEDPAHR